MKFSKVSPRISLLLNIKAWVWKKATGSNLVEKSNKKQGNENILMEHEILNL